MIWEIQITGDRTDLTELAKCLTDNEFCLEERNNQFFLKSTRLDHLRTHVEVIAASKDMLSLLTGATRLALGGKIPIVVANVARIHEDGHRDICISVTDHAIGRDFVGVEIHNDDGRIEIMHPAREVPNMAKLGLYDLSLAKALRLFGASEHDWVSLYRLYEVIEQNVGGIQEIINKGWATKDSIRRFKHTANSPTSSGDAARHGKESTLPLKNPMNLGEARSLIEFILHSWLRSKLHSIKYERTD